MSKLKYPTLSCIENKSYKLCDNDIKQITKLKNQGIKQDDIAERFNVNVKTIYHIFNLKALEDQRERGRIYKRNKYRKDPDYRKYHKDRILVLQKKRYHTDKKFREYRKIQTRENYKKKKKLMGNKK